MKQLHKIIAINLFVFFLFGCQNKTEKINKNSFDIGYEKEQQIKSLPTKDNGETIELFLKRIRKIAQSDDENNLKSFINFPLLGQGDGFEDRFETFEDLKSNGRIYSFFKESLAISIDIKQAPDLGEKWYSVRYQYPQGRNDYYNYFKIDKVDGKLKIVGVYIPGA